MKVYLIQQARSFVPKRLVFADSKLTDFEEISMGGILVEHPREGYVLVDNGFHTFGGNFVGKLVSPLPFVKTFLKNPVHVQIESHGINLGDIKHLIFTHLHFDHVGDVSAYPNAKIWAADKEVRAARGLFGIAHGYSPQVFQWDYRIERLVDAYEYNTDIAPFSIMKDIFGDQSILILSTPGHTAGSISVLVRSEDQNYLLCGDACYCRQNYRDDRAPGHVGLFNPNHHRRFARDTRKKINLWEKSDKKLSVIPLHDKNIWLDPVLFPKPFN